MVRFKAFNRLFVALFVGILSTILGMGLYMHPLRGDLTRLGGYLENNYGWNQPQETFPEPLFVMARSIQTYDRHFDVVVFGDSFSENEERGWQNYFAERVGWSIITFNMNEIELEEILSSAVYRTSPPKLLIYQSVERNIPRRHPSCASPLADDQYDHDIELPPRHPVGITPVLRERKRMQIPFDYEHVSSIFNYWRKALSRNVLGIDETEVHRTPNLRPELFSNKENDHILLITRDLLLKGVTGSDVKTAKCSLLALQDRIRASGTTEFALLVFPDKSSLYSGYITSEDYRNLTIAADLENTSGLNIARLWKQFSSEVERGTVDFYLPNDTHCGYRGYRIAAGALLDLLALTEGRAGS